jgi:hypothetical protein
MGCASWLDANRSRMIRGLPQLSLTQRTNPVLARVMAREYLEWLSTSYSATHGRTPTQSTLIVLWNRGLVGSSRRALPLATRRLVQRVELASN